MITQMRVKGLIFDPHNNAYIVVLRDEDNSDMLPDLGRKIRSECHRLGIESVTAPRPMTHDLMKSFLDTSMPRSSAWSSRTSTTIPTSPRFT